MEGASKPAWLIEAGVYGTEAEPLVAEIHRQGMNAEVVAYTAVSRGAAHGGGDRRLGDGDCVIGYGTYPFARQIQLHCGWVPGAWCNQDDLDCTTRFAHFGKFLLNQNYLIMAGVEAIRQQDWIYHVLGRDGQVFVRPAGCQKLFTGRCVVQAGFATALAPTRYDTATQVVVSCGSPSNAPPVSLARAARRATVSKVWPRSGPCSATTRRPNPPSQWAATTMTPTIHHSTTPRSARGQSLRWAANRFAILVAGPQRPVVRNLTDRAVDEPEHLGHFASVVPVHWAPPNRTPNAGGAAQTTCASGVVVGSTIRVRCSRTDRASVAPCHEGALRRSQRPRSNPRQSTSGLSMAANASMSPDTAAS